ncbi:uncharacterized protein LOC113308103 [Papaver somniferum]|uniref:uncharacterized protein LOC113308103 n=1 Tax=Papaver somniferum TaxID=3469 RepID=UPI000E6FB836|nr:uncharacterized protein LOC113308103 [Papaver somniferum]
MWKRKMKGVSVESSSSPFSYDEESRNMFNKHQSLIQDFNELQKETDAMKKKLHKDKQRKLTLLAEVRFLRRRYKFLMRSQSPNTPRIDRDLIRSQAPVSHKESYRMPKPSPVLDLNQISNGEDDVGDYHVSHRLEPPMRMEKKPKRSYSGLRVEQQQQHPSDANMLVCREVMNGSSRPGKRKISWQDQVALKV